MLGLCHIELKLGRDSEAGFGQDFITLDLVEMLVLKLMLSLSLLLMLMMRIVLATVCCILGN